MQEIQTDNKDERPAYEIVTEIEEGKDAEYFEVIVEKGIRPRIMLKFSQEIKSLRMTRAQAKNLMQLISDSIRKLPRVSKE